MNFSSADVTVLSHGDMLAFPLVLLAGAIASLNPCCVAIYPAAATLYCGAKSHEACCGTTVEVRARPLQGALAFVFGMAAANTILGIIAALAGTIFGELGPAIRYLVAFVPLMMGLHLIGWLRLPISSPSDLSVQSGWLGAFGAGLFLSIAVTPCGTPVLASVLAYVAYKGSSALGAALLFLYGFGAGLPIVLVGVTAHRFKAKLERTGCGLWTERISGSAMVALGLFLLWRA